MRFPEELAAGRFPVALEITPPQKPLPKVLLRRARLLGDAACAINVIQRPGRQSSLDASLSLAAEGFHPVWHLVTRGRTAAEIAADLDRAAAEGIRQLLCIRGDHAGADMPGAPTIRDVVAMAAERVPGALIGATLNQYAPGSDAVLRNLFPKLWAGASYIQTQPVFELEHLRPFAEAVRERSPETRIVAMAMPLLSLAAADKIEARLKVNLAPALRARIGAGEESAWSLFDDAVTALAESPLVDAVAIMTFETDAPPEMGARIVQALRRARIAA
ncbi:MAG: methylenetetrahydrofolate reductase [Hyphomicrobiales bacterium]